MKNKKRKKYNTDTYIYIYIDANSFLRESVMKQPTCAILKSLLGKLISGGM